VPNSAAGPHPTPRSGPQAVSAGGDRHDGPSQHLTAKAPPEDLADTVAESEAAWSHEHSASHHPH
jgi:hypothetical protein